jgi:hypothetical protein
MTLSRLLVPVSYLLELFHLARSILLPFQLWPFVVSIKVCRSISSHVDKIPLRSAGLGAGLAATKRLRYIPQKSPNTLPTMIRRCTGTNVKLKIATSGHTFQPLIISGHTSLRQSRMTAALSLPLKADIAATKANVLIAAPTVWSSNSFRAVFCLFNVLVPSMPIV